MQRQHTAISAPSARVMFEKLCRWDGRLLLMLPKMGVYGNARCEVSREVSHACNFLSAQGEDLVPI